MIDAASTWKIGRLLVDVDRGVVGDVEGGSGGMNPRAEALLLLLCRHPGQVVTRQQILDEIWGDRFVEEATITNTVWQIRRAIGEAGKAVLQTRSKRGYVLAIDPAEAMRAARAMREADSISSPPHAPGSASGMQGDTPESSAATAMGAGVTPRVSVRWRRPLLAFAAVAVCAVGLTLALSDRVRSSLAHEDGRIRFAAPTGSAISATVLVPQGRHAWLRKASIRTVAEQTRLRGLELVVFQSAQHRRVFASPHLQIALREMDADQVTATLRFGDASGSVAATFRGSPDAVPAAIHAFLEKHLPPAIRGSDYASQQYARGFAEEADFDRLAALNHYRRALAHDPGNIDTRLAMARIFQVKGRISEAGAVLRDWRTLRVSLPQRCRIETLAIAMSLEEIAEPACPRALRQARSQEMDLQAVLGAIAWSPARSRAPEDWLADVVIGIQAHVRGGDWNEAALALERAQRSCADAGWQRGVLELENMRAILATHQGKIEEAVLIRMRAADALMRMGDVDEALFNRTYAWRVMPIVPGPETSRRRVATASAAKLAAEAGNRQAEIDALELLARIDPPTGTQWRDRHARILQLADAALPKAGRIHQRHLRLSEMLKRRRYGEVVSGVRALKAEGADDPVSEAWNHLLLTRALMGQDRLGEAADMIRAMQRQKFDTGLTAGTCHFSWLLVEAGRELEAREMLELCRQTNGEDRVSRAARSDYGLLAEARLRQISGEPTEAWVLLQPRIDALLATREPLLAEANALAVLSRHAVGMTGADRARLQRALEKVTAISRQDGADVDLLFGVHLLRWRLCAIDDGTDCGPVLPAFAPEDRLEARLARDSVRR